MDSPVLFILLVALCIGSALTTLISFTLYIRTRLTERDHPDETGPDQHRRHEELDRKERLYQSIHFISLLAFVMLGVLILVIIARRID
ncbi:hypothetical protein Q4E93_25875 [Flavitalea sp. BT771]|uniref:hypothetical protein n=1 Tax=Flavitalea sp. BT771 TaxID=3063329 RepID=UPI0026E2437B|nr:hypothetical protein [Flavitalea sp. BT771]MDO6434064.1 hypothetical protein [Flavitalea sp. BT771]MDV6222964.1 hypothetical protein [Flavitalea sp. BT771]